MMHLLEHGNACDVYKLAYSKNKEDLPIHIFSNDTSKKTRYSASNCHRRVKECKARA